MDYLQNVISGADRSAGASALRLAASFAEPFYATAMRARNQLYDLGAMQSHDLGRPTISVGNITTGGTGKTPMVRWLAERLRGHGRRVAILARGYKSDGAAHGDEQRMLDAALNAGELSKVQLITNPNRVAAAAEAIARDSKIDVFLLDDAFQHRRARRDLDLVLLNAPEPFGFGHVLPRGLLRESLHGLSRAAACVLTHCDQVAADDLAALERRIREFNPKVPIYRTVHAHGGLKGTGAVDPRPMDWLSATPFFAFAGIGSPSRLDYALRRWGATYRGSRWFPDHYQYSAMDLNDLRSSATASGAQALVTTEKDWIKLVGIVGVEQTLPIWRIDMALQFLETDESRIWAQISESMIER